MKDKPHFIIAKPNCMKEQHVKTIPQVTWADDDDLMMMVDAVLP